jgi:hypothetical protein
MFNILQWNQKLNPVRKIGLVLAVMPAVVRLAVGLVVGLVVLLGVVLLVGAVVAAGLGFKGNGGGSEFRHISLYPFREKR